MGRSCETPCSKSTKRVSLQLNIDADPFVTWHRLSRLRCFADGVATLREWKHFLLCFGPLEFVYVNVSGQLLVPLAGHADFRVFGWLPD